MNWLKRWWGDLEDITRELINYLGAVFVLLAGVLFMIGIFNAIFGAGPPKGAQAYCLKECETTTLRLVSVELYDVEDKRGIVCHCAVRDVVIHQLRWQPDAGFIRADAGFSINNGDRIQFGMDKAGIYLRPGESLLLNGGRLLKYRSLDGGGDAVRIVSGRQPDGGSHD